MNDEPKKKKRSPDAKGGRARPSKRAVPLDARPEDSSEGEAERAAWAQFAAEFEEAKTEFEAPKKPDAAPAVGGRSPKTSEVSPRKSPPRRAQPSAPRRGKPSQNEAGPEIEKLLRPQSQVRPPKPASPRSSSPKPDSPRLAPEDIANLPQARLTRTPSYTKRSKRRRVSDTATGPSPRFTGATERPDIPSPEAVASTENVQPASPKVKPQKRTAAQPPSKEKLSHATQIFVQDALAAVDLLNAEATPPKQVADRAPKNPEVPNRSLPQDRDIVPPRPKKPDPPRAPKASRAKPEVTAQKPGLDPAKPVKKKAEETRVHVPAVTQEQPEPSSANQTQPVVQAERVAREWGRTHDGPAAKRAEVREGKVLEAEPDRYKRDSRPLAYRGAWWVAQPDIRPRRLPKLMSGVFKRSRQESRLLWAAFVLAVLAGGGFIGPKWLPSKTKGITERTSKVINITSAPLGAKVFWEGQPIGETPLAFRRELPSGTYQIRLERDGILPLSQKIEIREDEPVVKVHVPLDEYSALLLTSDPKGAWVRWGDKDLGQTPLKLDRLPLSESVVLEIGLKGHASKSLVLPLARELTEERHVYLYPSDATGKITVQAPRNLWIYEGNRRLGATGPTRIELPAGAHRLALVDPATGTRRNVQVKAVSNTTRRYFFDWTDAP